MKLDLKEWIAKVSATETQTTTAVGKDWKFTRIGNVVYVDASSDSNASISGGLTLLGTLNASMRPQYNVYLKCTNWNDDVRLMIDPNGAVNLYIPYSISGAHNLGFSGYSFIVGGVLRNPVIAVLTAISRIGGGLSETPLIERAAIQPDTRQSLFSECIEECDGCSRQVSSNFDVLAAGRSDNYILCNYNAAKSELDSLRDPDAYRYILCHLLEQHIHKQHKRSVYDRYTLQTLTTSERRWAA